MLRDSFPSYQTPSSKDLSAVQDAEVKLILSFIDSHVPSFSSYYLSLNESDKENRISDLLVHHFELCKDESGGYFPFRFSKNPTQAKSTKETDIGIFVRTRGSKPIPIFEFEAKRFSESSNNKEYVCGTRGGIERFKRGDHSSHLKVCGMFGYVQSRTSSEWMESVNNWIGELSDKNTDMTIDWSNAEKLKKIDSFPSVQKLNSSHSRKSSNDKIFLWHYLINLMSSN
ncbi:MAG: hypothetical protein RLO12_15355 [Fulvivirga sp.]|uniref:hypothetical protein n=1 Tax=Fulvivirga sp. TaxID=1931237 RepID=UPI0032F9F6CF